MPHSNILDPKLTALVVVDFQEGFRGAIPDFAVAASRISTAVRGFVELGLPILVTEQYPKGLGRTAEEVLFALPEDVIIYEKTTFSACGASGFLDDLEIAALKQIVLCGLETHICVSQTAHDLLDHGLSVHLLTDAVCSRFDRNKTAGIEKMQISGAIPSSVEMALFELLRGSTNENFKTVQALIK